ncbi:AB-hydrolase-associated lipase region [Penicillium camemberti]|uniref:AB-hydrolase-associated lipase region n=1 Tax=Penicillium camemberti (strain FM 013) TaxID=1429867 RepID=A0A0G4PE54_PENC3|nr:AB-hydrolase-associated lipase region [Penicillium camemberti]
MTMSVTTIPLEPLISTARAETSHAGAAIRDVQYDRIQPDKKGNVGVMVSDSKAVAAMNFSGTSSFREKQPSPGLHFLTAEHPLFPPMPSYGPPSALRRVQYYAFITASFFLSLCFLTAIFVGALVHTAGVAISEARVRCSGHNPDTRRSFYTEEQARRKARANADRRWALRQQKRDMDEEQGPEECQECPSLEGGKDPVVGDVAYYARRVGLDVETFRVQTEDGFIITLWHVYNPREYEALSPEERRERGPDVFTKPRISNTSRPQSNRRYPVLLVHGLLQSAGAFCTNDEDSLAFYLCKSGYDVWLGNNRCGSHPEHTTLSTDDPRMWSWDIRHLGTLDLAALTSRVLYETGFEKLGLVCHSQGTTQTFVALAKEHRPELGEYISVFCALAPAAYAGPLVSRPYFRFMSLLSPAMFRVIFGIHSFIPSMMTARRLLPPRIYGTLAYWVFSFLFDWSDTRWERDLRHRMFQFAPVYVSAESMRWWLGSDSFAKHKCILSTDNDLLQETNANPHMRDPVSDHGDDPGDACLGTPAPSPWYGPRTPPFAFWIGGSDALVDGRRLLNRFQSGREPHVSLVHSKIIEEYEHLDVLWAMDAIDQVGREVSQVIWTTVPDDARQICRTPRGLNLDMVDRS